MARTRPRVVAHVAVALDGTTRGFQPDLAQFYGLIATWQEDVTLAGADTILAQEPALVAAGAGPGPAADGPLLVVVDSRERVTAWQALRHAGHWRDAVPLRGPGAGRQVDLAAALEKLGAEGVRTVRVDSGGRLIGALLRQGLVDEVSLLVHPCLGSGRPWNDGVETEVMFALTHVERRADALVWLRYDLGPGPQRSSIR